MTRLETFPAIPHDGVVSLWESPDVAGMRTSYESGVLRRADLAATPLEQFRRWLADAVAAGLPEPNAMVLATAAPHRDEDGPWRGLADMELTSRVVLLKAAEGRGLSFFTNYTSRKAAAMRAQPEVSLLFPWFAMERQVSVSGVAEQLSAEESAEYFRSRPHGSQVAAWASRQSEPLAGREPLESRYAELGAQWPEGSQVPVPDFWGGYLVRVRSVEFWHGRQSRMHDRLRFVSVTGEPADLGDERQWQVQRYSP